MRTLRLLFWLRWTLFLRATNVSNRIAAALLPLLFALIFAPFYIGGAFAAFAGVMKLGAPAAVVSLGACQLAWLYFGMLFGAMGRSFDLDRLLRYPLRPAHVYAANILASCLEPVCLMTLPTVGAVALGVSARSGLAAGAVALAAGVLLTLVTGAVLQLLLAVLDEVLRVEWVRYVALALFSLTFVGLQLGLRGLSRGLLERLTHPGVTPAELVGFAAGAFGKVPTIGWPAALATGALDGEPLRALAGLAGTLALFALLLAPGARLIRHTARAGESAGGGPTKGGLTRGSFALPVTGLPHALALLVTREVRYTLQSPQRMVQLFLTPLVLVVFSLQRSSSPIAQPAFAVLLLGSAVTTAATTQFAFDGPGVRQFFLLPCAPRDVLLAKNLELFGRVAIQLTLLYVPLALFARPGWTSLGLTVFAGAAGVVFSSAALGTYVSIRWPVRARRRGLTTRSDGGWGGLAMLAGTVSFAALVGASIWAVRSLAGPAWAQPAGLAVAAVYLAIGATVWWVSLDRNAGALHEHRERLIETIARIEEV